jgi:hypothetical protein
MLDYENLDVYRTSLEFVITTIEIRDRLPSRVVKAYQCWSAFIRWLVT